MLKECKGFYVDDDLNIYSPHGNLLKPYVGSDGYCQVQYRRPNGKAYHARVHRIYAELFIPNPNGYLYVNHKDSNKQNNALDNLEWCTNSENVKHGWHSGNRTHHNRTAVNVYMDDAFLGTYPSIREAAKAHHVDRHKVARILKGEIPNRYQPLSFEYAEGQTTTENVAAA